MNIVTVCKPDAWVDTHLLRWRWLIHMHMPQAKCYLIVPYGLDGSTIDDVRAVQARLARHFEGVVPVREQPAPGFSVFIDMLRAGMLEAFGLDEALYIDADADVLENLESLPLTNVFADVLWTPNAVSRPSVAKALKAFAIPQDPPYVEPAVMYLRKSFTAEYTEVVNSRKLDMADYMPGINIWNVVVKRHPNATMLNYRYNVMIQRFQQTPEVSILHFCGKEAKDLRFRMGMELWPRAVIQWRDSGNHMLVGWEDSLEIWTETARTARWD